MKMLYNMKASEIIKCLDLKPHCEGGYFREVHRSGSIPMVTLGQTDFSSPTTMKFNSDNIQSFFVSIDDHQQSGDVGYESFTLAAGRSNRRPDREIRRNCLTTIFWMPTFDCPVLSLGINLSDHVHFYHGGASFEYITYDPSTKILQREILGPNIMEGEKLQVSVKGGVWKCGKLVASSSTDTQNNSPDFCLIGEAVAPGFDFHDFSWVTPEQLEKINPEAQLVLKPFIHDNIHELNTIQSTVTDASKYYNF